jgi:hypothetical protein
MLSVWTQHLRKDPEAKRKFEEYIKNSKQLTDRLDAILKGVEGSIERTETGIKAFDNPNWAYLQAYQNGCKGMLKQIQLLLSTDPEEK